MTRWTAVVQALVVTVLWSTSWVLTKWAFAYGYTPLTLTGLRYGLAAGLLAAYLALRGRSRATAAQRGRVGSPGAGRAWVLAAGLGVLGFGVAQGGQNLGLFHLGATNASLVLGLSNTLQVLLLSAVIVGERPRPRQAAGLALGMMGLALFYYPWDLASLLSPGLWPLLVAGTGYAGMTVGMRMLMRRGVLPAAGATYPGMLAGAILLLVAGAALEPPQSWDWRGLVLIGWMAGVNTALAFTLWAHTQRTLQAFESVILNNTMTVQIALLAWWLLGEQPTPAQWLAVAMIAAATTMVNLPARRGSGSVPARG